MSALLLVKASLLLSATLLAVFLLRRAPAVSRHRLWTLAFAALLALPLLPSRCRRSTCRCPPAWATLAPPPRVAATPRRSSDARTDAPAHPRPLADAPRLVGHGRCERGAHAAPASSDPPVRRRHAGRRPSGSGRCCWRSGSPARASPPAGWPVAAARAPAVPVRRRDPRSRVARRRRRARRAARPVATGAPAGERRRRHADGRRRLAADDLPAGLRLRLERRAPRHRPRPRARASRRARSAAARHRAAGARLLLVPSARVDGRATGDARARAGVRRGGAGARHAALDLRARAARPRGIAAIRRSRRTARCPWLNVRCWRLDSWRF